MIIIKIPNNNIAERQYILDVIFNEFLGLYYILEIGSNDYEIILSNQKQFSIKDRFFNNFSKDLEYLKEKNIPKSIKELDMFAACFFMLTRWEEHVNKSRDVHDRFPAYKSLAYKEDFLDKPIVNEMVENLKKQLLELDKSLLFKERIFKQYISCDVDEPFDCTVENFKILIRTIIGDMIKRKSFLLAFKRIRRYTFNKFENYRYDDNYTFKWYMDICEQHDFQIVFYVIPDSSEDGNSCYKLEDQKIQRLLKYIDKRGHKIGVHSTYQTYKDKEKAKLQKDILDKILKQLNIKQTIKENRQHYLRWDSSTTPQVLEYIELEYDTTGGYADMIGFRYGVCYEFSMFDILNRQKLNLKQRPLIVMECTLIDEAYMNYGYTKKTITAINDLKSKCKKYNGNFSLLWHNNHFKNKEDINIFKKALLC